jgi:hypothetical protein
MVASKGFMYFNVNFGKLIYKEKNGYKNKVIYIIKNKKLSSLQHG